MIAWIRAHRRGLTIAAVAVAVVAAFVAWLAWYKLFREVPEAPWEADAEHGHSAADERFLYGSVGAERDAGIPYWIVYVLPRVFPDLLPGPNGLASLGLPWEEGKELPVGFTTKVIGFRRVAQSCAACHTATYRTGPEARRVFVPTGPAHTFDLEAFFRFLIDCAKDPRFNADRLMNEIELARPPDFGWLDKLLYRHVLIPITRQRLLAREAKFKWIYLHDPLPPRWPQASAAWPDWGRGRDDAMNLTKYFLTTSPTDVTLGPTDMPSLWNLGKYKLNPGTRMNLAGDSWDANSVIIDSALGLLGAAPPSNDKFLDEVHWLNKYLDDYPAPPFPFPIDPAKAGAGKAVYDANCASCHRSARTGTVMQVGEVGTDVERLRSWNKDAAVRANEAVKAFGIDRRGLVEADPTGYVIPFLDGIWLRAPYLHNGSVPTLRDLLNPASQRPPAFYRGYDVYDSVAVGFVSLEEQARRLGVSWDEVKRTGSPYDVSQRSCGNQGHEFGVNLPAADKDALVEYLKTIVKPLG
jgi:mono/diheme cytochrome c family protein